MMEVAAGPALGSSAAMPSLRVSVAAALRYAALLALSVAIILSPFRARFVLEERPLPNVFPDYTDLLLFWNEIVILAAIGLWLLSLAARPRRIAFGPLAVSAPVLLLAAAICVSVPFSQDEALAAYNAVTLLGFVGFGLFVSNTLRSITQVASAIAIMIAIQAVIAITQSLEQASLGLSAIGELRLDPEVRGVSILWTEGRPLLLRAYGLSDHPNILGGVLAASLLVFMAGVSRLREEWFVLSAGIFVVGVAALFVTFSRAAGLGLGAGLALALVGFLATRDWTLLRRWLVAGVIAAMVTLPFVWTYSPFLEGRVNPTAQPADSPEERSIAEREALARETGDMFLANIATGVGPGVLPTALYNEHPDFEWNYFPAHVAILVVAAETGIVGLAAYGALMVVPWFLLWRRRRSLTPELIGVSGALFALQVAGLFDYYTWSLDAGRIWFWLVLGLWLVAYRNAGFDSDGRLDAGHS